MRSKEKMYIIVLLIIGVVAVIFLMSRGEKQEQVNPAPQAQQQQTTQNAGQQANSEEKQIAEEQKQNFEAVEFTQQLGNEVSLNTSDKLMSAKTYNGIEISDIQLSKKGEVTELLATAKNTTSKEIPFQLLKIKFVDKEKKEIITISCGVKKLAAGESTQISTSAPTDFVNAYDFEIVK